MKTKTRKSLQLRGRPSRRKSTGIGMRKILYTVNNNDDTIVLSDSDSEHDENQNQSGADEEDIQVIDIADSSDIKQDNESICNFSFTRTVQINDTSTTDAVKSSPNEVAASSGTGCSTSTSANEPTVINIEDDPVPEGDDDGIEVVAILVSRRNRTPKRKRSSSNKSNSSNNGSIGLMQESIKWAKNTVRRNSFVGSVDRKDNVYLNGISANSRQIKRNKKQKKKQEKQQLGGGNFCGRNQMLMNRTKEFDRKIVYKTDMDNGILGAGPWESLGGNLLSSNHQFQPNGFIPFASSTPLVRGRGHFGRGRGNHPRPPWNPRNKRYPGPAPVAPGSNVMNVGSVSKPLRGMRPIVIDGSNVAIGHGKMLHHAGKFSSRGIEICIDYFSKRGHQEIVVFVPRFRQKKSEALDPELLEKLEQKGHVKFTPSREAGGQRIASYDDLYVVQYAHDTGGIIVSNDNYRDIYENHEHWRETITLRILQYTWITQDFIMFPQDPLGRNGPSLDEFLRF